MNKNITISEMTSGVCIAWRHDCANMRKKAFLHGQPMQRKPATAQGPRKSPVHEGEVGQTVQAIAENYGSHTCSIQHTIRTPTLLSRTLRSASFIMSQHSPTSHGHTIFGLRSTSACKDKSASSPSTTASPSRKAPRIGISQAGIIVKIGQHL